MKAKIALKCVAVLCAMALMGCGDEESESDGSGGSPDGSDPPNAEAPADVCGAPMEKTCDLPAPVGACDTSAQFGFCIEYFEECLLEDPELEAGCADLGGRFIRGGGCPVAGRLGACVDESLASAVAHVYQTPGVTAQQVETSCEGDGDAVFCAP